MGFMLVSLNQCGLCRVRKTLSQKKKKKHHTQSGHFMVSIKIMSAYSAGMDMCRSQLFTVFYLGRVSLCCPTVHSQLAGPQPPLQLSCLAVGVLELDMVAPTIFYIGSEN